MTEPVRIRLLAATDTAGVAHVLETSGLFPPDLLGPMVAPYLKGEAQDIWLLATRANSIVGFTYAAPERMTEGTWNMLAIAVDKVAQGQRIGRQIVAHLEQMLLEQKQRLLLVETSGLADYEPTRRFYRTLGYAEVARIPDFYQAGEDKQIFCKALPGRKGEAG
jgi:ribosomal protein S18 acetylase RimI-like enzyme